MIPFPEPNPAFHASTMSGEMSEPSAVGGIFDFLNSVASGIGSVGTSVYNSLAGVRAAELNYAQVGQPTPADKNVQYLLIGGAIIVAILLLKN